MVEFGLDNNLAQRQLPSSLSQNCNKQFLIHQERIQLDNCCFLLLKEKLEMQYILLKVNFLPEFALFGSGERYLNIYSLYTASRNFVFLLFFISEKSFMHNIISSFRLQRKLTIRKFPSSYTWKGTVYYLTKRFDITLRLFRPNDIHYTVHIMYLFTFTTFIFINN